jgi:hypothetical protein
VGDPKLGDLEKGESMSTVTRNGFRSTFEDGIDLGDKDLEDALPGSGVTRADLEKADLNGDGIIRGRKELDLAFKVVDGVDHNRKSSSFLDAGEAGQIYRGMLAAKAPPPYYGMQIAQAARDRVAADSAGYADANAPRSPLAGLSGNVDPGVTRPSWLQDQNKCNQFVGDALTAAGVRAPTVTMADGSLHYGRAETWPARTDLFDRVTDPADVRVGDVLVRDYPRQGAGGAHVEIVTGLHPLRTTGAHETGAYEQSNGWLQGSTYNAANRSFSEANGNEVYILRPQRRIGE